MSDAFKITTGLNSDGTPFAMTGLPVVKITDDPDDPYGARVKLQVPDAWAGIRGKYVLFPVGEIRRLVKYLEALA